MPTRKLLPFRCLVAPFDLLTMRNPFRSWLKNGNVDVNKNLEENEKGSCLQARYVVIFACFLANAVSYAMRVNLSVAIVAMTLDSEGQPNSPGPPNVPLYDWSSGTQGTILSSFFWGYLVTQVPGGYLAQRLGPRYTLLSAMIISSLATLLFVPAAALGWEWACASRIILGLAQGPLMPCCHCLLGRWSVPSERGRMAVYAYTGQQLGTVMALSGAGVLSASAGWPAVFYVTGGMGVVMCILWFFLVADSPSKHRLASPKERRYIESAIAEDVGSHKAADESKPLATPWRAIMTSKPMLGLFVVHCAQNWGFWTLLTEIPSYMNGVLGFDLAKNGLLSALPYLAMWFFGLVLSWISDLLIVRKCYSVATSRKLANSLAHYGSAVSLMVLAFMQPNAATAVAILTVAVAVSAGTNMGYNVNYVDLSPNFAGTTMGIGNGIGNIMSLLGPLFVGFIVTDTSNEQQWKIVFLVAAGFYILGNTTFIILMSATVQPWNNPNWMRRKMSHQQQVTGIVTEEASSNEQPRMKEKI